MDSDTRHLIEVNAGNLGRVISFVDVIDGKAKFVLTLVLALSAYFVNQLGPYLDAHAKSVKASNWGPPFFILLDVVALGCLFGFIVSAITIIWAIKPKTTQHTGRPSPLFFGTIAGMALEDFKTKMKSITPNDVIDQLADQTYDNAKIVSEKTSHVQRSIRFFYFGMTCFFVFTIARPILVSLLDK